MVIAKVKEDNLDLNTINILKNFSKGVPNFRKKNSFNRHLAFKIF